MRAFTPGPATATIALSAASQAVKLSEQAAALQVRICNRATDVAFIAFGDSTVTATGASMPIMAGSVEVLTLPVNAGGGVYVAAISSGAVGNISFTLGGGL